MYFELLGRSSRFPNLFTFFNFCFGEVDLPTSRFSQSGNLAKEILSRHFPPKFRRIFVAHGLKTTGESEQPIFVFGKREEGPKVLL